MSLITELSVISSTTWSGVMPWSRRTCSYRSATSGPVRLCADTFTETFSSSPRAIQRFHHAHDCTSISDVSSSIIPPASISGTNCAGGTMRPSGSRQRSSCR